MPRSSSACFTSWPPRPSWASIWSRRRGVGGFHIRQGVNPRHDLVLAHRNLSGNRPGRNARPSSAILGQNVLACHTLAKLFSLYRSPMPSTLAAKASFPGVKPLSRIASEAGAVAQQRPRGMQGIGACPRPPIAGSSGRLAEAQHLRGFAAGEACQAQHSAPLRLDDARRRGIEGTSQVRFNPTTGARCWH